MSTDYNFYPIYVSGSIDEAVKAGNYDLCDLDINDQHFQADRPHGARIILIHIPQDIDGKDSKVELLDYMGLRPVTMSELLALGAEHPELQHQFSPIIALDSAWQNPRDGRNYYGCLTYYDARTSPFSGYNGKRMLKLEHLEDSFGCRMAAKHK